MNAKWVKGYYIEMDIAIWGTGNVGKYIYEQLENNKNYRVRYFVDSNALLTGKRINGIEILSPEQLQKRFTDELEFVLIAFIDGISIYERLLDMKLSRFGIVRNRVFELKLHLMLDLFQDPNIFWNGTAYSDKPLLRNLETNIVDNCNLNCKGCSHFSNLFNHDACVPFDVYCRDLKQIADNVYIYQFNMLGGEAILNDRILEYIDYTRKLLPYTYIELVSNGLLIPRQPEEFFQCCALNDITISISGYKPTLLLQDKIRDILERYHIAYIFREDVKEFGKNIDLSGTADKEEAVQRCRENKCHFFRYGKIYKCPFEALGNVFFEHFGLDVRLNGGIDIYEKGLNWDTLTERLQHEPVEACRYCGPEEKIEWEVANQPEVDDWLI